MQKLRFENAYRFAIVQVLILLVFLPAVSRTSEFKISILDFKNLVIWRIKDWYHARIDVRIDISIFIRPISAKFAREVHLQEFSQMRLIKQVLMTYNIKIMWQTKNLSSSAVPVPTRLGGKITYLYELLPIKSHDPLITWSCKIMWQTKIISPLSAGW